MAEETKVHANEPAKKAGEKPATKDGNWIEKHKGIAYGGMAVVLIVLYIFLKRGSSSSTSAQTAADSSGTQGGIDPATGYLYGSPADEAALGSSGSSTSTPGNTTTTTTTNNYSGGTSGTTSSGGIPGLSVQQKQGNGSEEIVGWNPIAGALKYVINWTGSGNKTQSRTITGSADTATIKDLSKNGKATVTAYGASGIIGTGSLGLTHAKG